MLMGILISLKTQRNQPLASANQFTPHTVGVPLTRGMLCVNAEAFVAHVQARIHMCSI